MLMEAFPKEEDAEPLPGSRGADGTGTLTAPDPASDFITFGREKPISGFERGLAERGRRGCLSAAPRRTFFFFSGGIQRLRNV